MGTDMPTSGERPFKIDKNAKDTSNNYSKIKGTSYLNEQRLKEHVSTTILAKANLVLFYETLGEQHGTWPQLQEKYEEVPRPALSHD